MPNPEGTGTQQRGGHGEVANSPSPQLPARVSGVGAAGRSQEGPGPAARCEPQGPVGLSCEEGVWSGHWLTGSADSCPPLPALPRTPVLGAGWELQGRLGVSSVTDSTEAHSV